MSRFSDFVQISKPRIITLLLVVGWAAMFLAEDGFPELLPFLAVTVAGICSTASSGAFNNVLEKDRDARMGRTADRPVASGRISVRAASIYATIMAVIAVAPLVALQLWVTAGLVVGAIAYYVIVYTVLLKPSTVQNIVIGGFAGSFPALIGWSAVTGDVSAWPPWAMAILVFMWTPAHFWALALLYKDDYAAADYPMYPIVKGDAATRRLIVVYSVLTLVTSLSLFWGGAGVIYLAGALFFGGVLVVRSIGLTKAPSPKKYRSFFLYTIQYLGFTLIALMVDLIVPL